MGKNLNVKPVDALQDIIMGQPARVEEPAKAEPTVKKGKDKDKEETRITSIQVYPSAFKSWKLYATEHDITVTEFIKRACDEYMKYNP